MIDKRVSTMAEALSGVEDGATILVGGFGSAGLPTDLVEALLDTSATDLTVVCNNAGGDDTPIARLIWEKRIRRFICSYPRSVSGAHQVKKRWEEGSFELELVPQGTMSERMRAAGAGLGGFFTPTAGGTMLAEGKETRMIGGRLHVFEEPLPGDYALIKADTADRWGNLTYHASGRNFGPTMASAAATTVVQVRQFVELGELDPEQIITPGIFVDRVIEVGA
ncbi:3-oxoacid CoA-transferase subunit A [Epidermidibacterium keratini]|uniref:3-oxoacid CoA-transferase subunit A n=1 Tax=Epidermidibacterium keratini TaxID=1891644 RepID=A0A7M3T510_9ACTN|nr:3-oxoacid CoA-transferase subunit A [Epidermidibacterium keratini]QHB98862.1 3-oxoacid CoA-transferase subunit A [Epidermidibacterium keratini]